MAATKDLLQLVLYLRHVDSTFGHSRLPLLLGSSIGWFEICPQCVIETIPVPSNLNGKELDLDGEHGVLFAVVLSAVHSEERPQAEILHVLVPVAELPPLNLGLLILQIILSQLPKVKVRKTLLEILVNPRSLKLF